MIREGCEPFFLPSAHPVHGKQGVLLIHGFTGVPADMILMGEELHRQGFTVLGVRLAGHGTSETDLSRQTSEDWMDSVRDGYAVLSGICEDISVVGHSMGGLFAMQLSLEVPIRRIVSLATPIKIAPERGADMLPPREACEGVYVTKKRRPLKDVPAAVNQSYRRMPLMSVHELMDEIERLKHVIGEVTAPILIEHSRLDHTAAPESAEYIFSHVKSRVKRLFWLTDCGHLLPLDRERGKVFAAAAEFLAENG